MNEPQEAQPIPRFTSQKSWDGLSHRMVEFESGEYVRYADFHKAEAALAEAQEKLRNATGTIQRLEQEQVHMAAPALAEAALAEAQQERDEARDQLIALGFFEACQSCDHNHGWHEGECDHRSENGSPCGCEEFKPNDVQKLDRAQQRIGELEQALQEAEAANERDRTALHRAVHDIDAEIKGRMWLLDGRGCYEWDDDKYRQEFGWAVNALEHKLEVLRKISHDLRNCPVKQADVDAARTQEKPL